MFIIISLLPPQPYKDDCSGDSKNCIICKQTSLIPKYAKRKEWTKRTPKYVIAPSDDTLDCSCNFWKKIPSLIP